MGKAIAYSSSEESEDEAEVDKASNEAPTPRKRTNSSKTDATAAKTKKAKPAKAPKKEKKEKGKCTS